MTVDRSVALLESRIGPREMTNIESEEVEAMINTARHRAAREAFKSDHRALAENVYNLTLGAADAQGVQKASFSSNSDLLTESIPYCKDIQHATVNAAVGLAFEILPHVSDLRAVRSTSQVAYAAVGDKAVYTRYPAGPGLAAAAGLLVRAVQVPDRKSTRLNSSHRT